VVARKTIASGTAVEVLFTLAERDLIVEHTFAGPDLTDRLQLATVKGTKLAVKYTLDDLDELLGYIAAEANHSENKKLEKQLDKMWGRLKKKMESYDDGGWQEAF
jgi:hypothetical protein